MKFEIKNTKTDNLLLVNMIVYGESGVGKTSLMKSLPSESILVLNAENGLLSVKGHGVDYVNVKTATDVMSVLDNVEKSKYKTVFIDSITELSQNHFVILKDKYTARENSEGKKPGTYNMQIWGDFLADFAKIFKKLRDMEKNVVAFGLVKEKEDAAGAFHKSPDIYGKTSDRIMAWFDECFYMYIDNEGVRRFLTQTSKNVNAKDRSTKLDKIEPAILSDIFKKIQK